MNPFSGKRLDLSDPDVEAIVGAGGEAAGYIKWRHVSEEAYRRGGQNLRGWEAWQSTSWPLGVYPTRGDAVDAVLARERNAERRRHFDGW
jgi:hypothetical protein